MIEKYLEITDPVELYNVFKQEFFEFIVKNIAESDKASLLISHYNDFEYNSVRMIIDEEVSVWSDIMLLNKINNISDPVNDLAYKNWKKLEDMYMYFDEVYTDLIEINL